MTEALTASATSDSSSEPDCVEPERETRLIFVRRMTAKSSPGRGCLEKQGFEADEGQFGGVDGVQPH